PFAERNWLISPLMDSSVETEPGYLRAISASAQANASANVSRSYGAKRVSGTIACGGGGLSTVSLMLI
ncbi:MAG: hypothetical protein KDA90_22725, partial [Planctomycetaceae bacterium]|nr:hypothetical protein [Planctomycetaceae bacterium]